MKTFLVEEAHTDKVEPSSFVKQTKVKAKNIDNGINEYMKLRSKELNTKCYVSSVMPFGDNMNSRLFTYHQESQSNRYEDIKYSNNSRTAKIFKTKD